jgi:hypothetical protein
MKSLKRALRVVCVTALVLAVLLSAGVQFQQRLLRWRAEQLIADMHRVRLYQSTWADAQRLMRRWGAWGRYEGICNATDCRYEINLGDASYRAFALSSNTWEWLRRLQAYPLYRLLGGRYSCVRLAFVVQDGTIWRTSTSVDIDVPPKLLTKDDEGYMLLVKATSQQVLVRTEDGGTLGRQEQLSQHPYYKAGRPGGCENCLMVRVTYSTHTPQSEIERLTSFDLSCVTRLIACRLPEDLLPAAREWHLYGELEPDYRVPGPSQSPPRPCDIPIWAVARDAVSAFVVDAIPTAEQEQVAYGKEKSEADLVSESASVRIVQQLKGAYAWKPGTVVEADTFSGRHYNPPPQQPEHLTFGNRYILLASSEDHGKEPALFMDRCGVQKDTPEVREELEKGFAQNDNLRGPELR